MKIRMTILSLAIILMFTSALLATPIALTIDFAGTTGGTLDVSNPGDVVGTDIKIDTLSVYFYDSALAPASQYYFVKYDVTGEDANSTGILNFDTGVQGNFIEILGAVDDLQIDYQQLLSGSFSSWQVGRGLVQGVGADIKAEDLVDALGLSDDTQFHFYGFSTGTYSPDGGKTYIANSTDISNTPVPEPSTMILLGMGILGLGLIPRRFKK